jgi:putative glycosyltransferase
LDKYKIMLYLGLKNLIQTRKFFGLWPPGWTSVIASIWAVGGLIMLSIGIVGIYLKKIMEEVKARPYTTLKNIYKSEK